MECSFCHKNVATCHLTKIVAGSIVELHVCETCIPELAHPNEDFDVWEAISLLAKKLGIPDPSMSIEPPLEKISAKTLSFPKMDHPPEELHCSACGFTSENVRKTGRLGCPNCYDVFESVLKEVIRDCQKGMIHRGKISRNFSGLLRQKLQQALEEAVQNERFEEAAKLRDQLRNLS